MFADRLDIAQVVIAFDQPVEYRLKTGAPHQADLQGSQRSQGSNDRALVQQHVGCRFAAPGQGVGGRTLLCRQFDMPGAVQLQHHAAADHVPKRSIGLPPIPCLAQQSGELTPTGLPMVPDQLANEANIFAL